MKRCPQCNQFAISDTLTFCRADGVRLIEDSGSFSDQKTVTLLPDAPPGAATSVMDDPLNVPAAAPHLMDSSKVTDPTRNLIRSKKRQIGVAVIAAIIILTLAGSAYYSLSRRNNTTINSLAVLPFINVNADQQL